MRDEEREREVEGQQRRVQGSFHSFGVIKTFNERAVRVAAPKTDPNYSIKKIGEKSDDH